MKWLLAIAVSLLVITGRAQTQDSFGNWILSGYTNTVTNATLTAVATVHSAPSTYHTVLAKTTNAAWISVTGSIDGTNYVNIATNAITANVVYATNIVGKFKNLQVSLRGTNIGCNFDYMGGK